MESTNQNRNDRADHSWQKRGFDYYQIFYQKIWMNSFLLQMITSFSLLVHVYLVHMNQMEILHFLPRCVEEERSPRMREIGVRSLVATDISRKKGSDSSTAKRSATSVSVTGPRR